MQPFKVQKEDAVNFAKVWTLNGIAVPLTEVHHQFATDYANVVLRNFIQMIQQQAAAKQKAVEEAAAKEAEPKIIIAKG